MQINRRRMLQLAAAGVAAGFFNHKVLAETQPITAQTTFTLPSAEHPLLLNFNENSLGMSASARQAVINHLNLSNRYPDSEREGLIEDIAKRFNLNVENVGLGNGSSEAIEAVISGWIQQANDKKQAVQVIAPDPTFGIYEDYAVARNVPVVKVPLKADLSFDLDAIRSKADQFDGISIIYLCNPNNPTALLTPNSQLAPWLDNIPENHRLLIDEAYAEYAEGDPQFTSAIEWARKGTERLAVTRTFSKLYALAGLRIGYMVAAKSEMDYLRQFLSADNINLTAAVAARATLADNAFLQESRRVTDESRSMVMKALDELGLTYMASSANFIFHRIKGDSVEYAKKMKAYNIVVGRAFPPLTNYNRLTLGTPEEMAYLIQVWKEFRTKGWI
ncbi:pyridoxal phosphate-dependent aminotransferase [Avibacterium volantium]|uniref:pyridoxal phosphate-dependent aminotransferase n=1 Tax=Avibacterium volantium TaxID=762 RepID=UPI003BF90DA8